METSPSARKAASEGDELRRGAEPAADAVEQYDETSSSPLRQTAALCETLTARLEDVVATCMGLEQPQPVALTKLTLDVSTFTGRDARKSVADFLDELSVCRTISGVSEQGGSHGSCS